MARVPAQRGDGFCGLQAPFQINQWVSGDREAFIYRNELLHLARVCVFYRVTSNLKWLFPRRSGAPLLL
jgi:hypothetical protein